jgi:uncharacterized protein
MLDFEWDERESVENLKKHGVSFEAASGVFNDPFALDFEDRTMDDGEVRRSIIRMANALRLMIAYTEREDTIRLISARKATRPERKQYDDGKYG